MHSSRNDRVDKRAIVRATVRLALCKKKIKQSYHRWREDLTKHSQHQTSTPKGA
jgi:hypothetical protein